MLYIFRHLKASFHKSHTTVDGIVFIQHTISKLWEGKRGRTSFQNQSTPLWPSHRLLHTSNRSFFPLLSLHQNNFSLLISVLEVSSSLHNPDNLQLAHYCKVRSQVPGVRSRKSFVRFANTKDQRPGLKSTPLPSSNLISL